MTQPSPDAAFEIEGAARPGRWVVICDHASNFVPDWVNGGHLGLPPGDMARHIAWDVGAAGVARALGRRLDSPVVLSRFSRLVIDPNRGEDDPTVLMRIYDGSVIPANRHAGPEEKARRVAGLHRPYHDAVDEVLDARVDPVVLSIHSFTAQLRGRAFRPWQVGVLSADVDRRLSEALLARLAEVPDLCFADNQPYSGNLPGDSIDRHALKAGRHNALLELRNDLIGTAAAQSAWADRLAPPLRAALADLERQGRGHSRDPVVTRTSQRAE